jgi:phage major head subunit gpT-like protein
MEVTLGNLEKVFTGLKAIFLDAVRTSEAPEIARLMATVPSQTSAEEYPSAALLGDLEIVLDEVTMTNIGKWIQRVENKTYARIVQIKRDHIADDNIGVYRVPVQALGRRANLYPLRLAAESLLSGFTDVWIDGATVFSAAHTWVNGGAWSNLGGPSALDAVHFGQAYQAMEQATGPDGAPLDIMPDLLVCGPANRAAAEAILLTKTILGTDNPNYNRVDLMILRRFGTSTAWMLACTRPIQPMVLQDREGPEFIEDEDPKAHVAFYQEKYAYKGRRRCAVAILAPWLIRANRGV